MKNKNRRIFKKILSLVLSLSLVISFSIPAFADENSQGAGLLEDLTKIKTTSTEGFASYISDLIDKWSKNADSIKTIKVSDAIGNITESFGLQPYQKTAASEQTGLINTFIGGFDGKAISLDALKKSMELLNPRLSNIVVDTVLGSDNIESIKSTFDKVLNLVPTTPGATIERTQLTEIEDMIFEAFENAGVFKDGSDSELNIIKNVLNVINEAIVGRDADKASEFLNTIKVEIEKFSGENSDMTGKDLISSIFSGIENYFNSAGDIDVPDGTPVIITIVTNDGSEPILIDAITGQSLDLSEIAPTREGFTFGGWYTDEALTQQVTVLDITGDVTIYAKWTENEVEPNPVDENPFTDVNESDYFYNPVLWAVKYNITEGTSPTTFSPESACTRAQAMTFIWRAAGEPTVSGQYNAFTDIKPSDYYYQAVLWGVSIGLTTGTSPTTFSPNDPCTRAQIVTFLYRGSGKIVYSGATPFTDVPEDAYYAKAVSWAVSEGITTGTSSTTFSPDLTCTRGQIVTFLYRFVN